MIGPVSYHRTRLAQGDRRNLLSTSAWLARCGLIALLVAAVASVFLALDVAVGRELALTLTAPVAVLLVGVWYALPALRGRFGRPEPGREQA